jgi:hypothetical protein
VQAIRPRQAVVPVAQIQAAPRSSQLAYTQAHAPGQTQTQGLAFGPLFRDLRRALSLSLPDVAGRLGTRIEVISALEGGDVRRLPPWPETVRVVTLYTGLAGIDPRPILGLIHREIAVSDAVPVADTQEPGEAGVLARLRELYGDVLGRAGERFGRVSLGIDASRASALLDGRRLSAVGAVLVILVALFAQASTLQASLATLQPPIMGLMRGAQDYLLTRVAPQHDGLRWIEVDDPRQRRTDRLPVTKPRSL